jgi:hypothetical protein
MSVLTAYRGVVEKNGLVRLQRAPALPAGTEVVVVMAQPLPSIEEQKRRLAALSPEEWRQPFEAIYAAWNTSEPAPDEENIPGDEELVALVHQVRDEQ